MTIESALERAARDACRAARSIARNRGPVRGAALLDVRGRIFGGPEVRPAAGVGAPAETTALVRALLSGSKRFRALLVRGGADGTKDAGPPSGAALQMLYEFSPTCRVHWGTARAPRGGVTVQDLLPGAFGPRSLSDVRRRRS